MISGRSSGEREGDGGFDWERRPLCPGFPGQKHTARLSGTADAGTQAQNPAQPCPLCVSPTGSRFIPTLTLALTATKPRKEGWGGPGGRSVPTCWGLTF